jgi:hypothetical protein
MNRTDAMRYRQLPCMLIGCFTIFMLFILGYAVAAQEGLESDSVLGQKLAKRVLKTQETSGFRLRARGIVGKNAEEDSNSLVMQVRITGRKEKEGMRVLYQIMWPQSLKGHAAVIEQRSQGGIGGFVYEPPDTVKKLTHEMLMTPFAGSALTYEDLAESFWRWPHQRASGKGRAGKQECSLLESRPSPETASAYSLVRSCVETKRGLPLWIEKSGKDGKVALKISFETADRKNQQDFQRAMIVERGAAKTRIEFLKIERGVTIPPEEMSVEQLKAKAENPR